MRYTNYIFSAILFANLFASCAIAKRAHTTGFYGAWPDESKQQSGQDYSSKNLPENVRETQNVADPKTALKGPENTHFDTGQCDLIVLTNGDEIYAKVSEINLSEIKYRRCDNMHGPIIYVAKSSVFFIKYPNGIKDIITPHNSNTPKGPLVSGDVAPAESPAPRVNPDPSEQREPGPPNLEGFGAIGMLVGLIGLFAPMPIGLLALCGLIAAAFGLVSISKITGNRDTKSGMFFAILSLLLGLILLGVLVMSGL